MKSLEMTRPSSAVDKLDTVPTDQIIAMKEGMGLLSEAFPKSHGSGLHGTGPGTQACPQRADPGPPAAIRGENNTSYCLD
ncbi:MAG: hypothetical protein ACLQVL_38110 [Terriglobia bacterium]